MTAEECRIIVNEVPLENGLSDVKFTKEPILKAVNCLSRNKAPDIDGLGPNFFSGHQGSAGRRSQYIV